MKSMLAIFSLAILLSVVAAKHSKKPDDKVKIAVYYESLCPDSKKFITTQLAPVWHDLRGIVKVKLVPYGKATHEKIDNVWNFTCHHGPDECYGNKVQSCILKNKNIVDTDKVDLIVCLMSQQNPDKSMDICAQQKNLKTETLQLIKDCADSPAGQGNQLLAANGDKTGLVQKPLTSVPTIVINEKYDQIVHEEALTSLKAVVCRAATKKPSVCN